MRTVFLSPDVADRERAKFLQCVQGKRSFEDYIQELRTLVIGMSAEPLSEDVKLTIFMQGMRPSSAKTQLFRAPVPTLDAAFPSAMTKDYVFRQALKNRSAPTNAGGLNRWT